MVATVLRAPRSRLKGERGSGHLGERSIQRLDPAKNCDNRLNVMGDPLMLGNIFTGSDDQPRVKKTDAIRGARQVFLVPTRVGSGV